MASQNHQRHLLKSKDKSKYNLVKKASISDLMHAISNFKIGNVSEAIDLSDF